MRAIFISYRRDDAEGQAGRLFGDLTQQFGNDAVFMDVAAIEPGRDFRRAIDEHVSACGVLLAIIGSNWLTAKGALGSRRLDDSADFVRLETASALKRDIPVVPVLVHGASMPRAEELPDDLKELAFRNAVELRHARWDSDVQELVKALRPYVQAKEEPAGPPTRSALSESAPTRSSSKRMIVASLVGVSALALGGYLLNQNSTKGPAGPTPARPEAEKVPAPVAEAPTSPAPVPVQEAKRSPAPVAGQKAQAEAERTNKEKIAEDEATARQARMNQLFQSYADQSAALNAKNESAAPEVSMTFARNSRALASVPAGHRLIGKWYDNGLGPSKNLRYEFTDRSAYSYFGLLSSYLRTSTQSGTIEVENDKLTLHASDGTIKRYTFRFECIGTGSVAEYLTLSDDETHVEAAYFRDPTDTGQRCK